MSDTGTPAALNANGNLVPANLGAKPEVVETHTEPTIPNADKGLEAIKARVKAANPHLDDPSKLPHQFRKPVATPVKIVAEPAPGDAKVDPGAGDGIKPDPVALLSQLAKVQGHLQETTEKLKLLEVKTGDSEYGAELKKLWGGGDKDKLNVLAKLSGKTAEQALADMVEIFYNQDGGAVTDAKPVAASDPLLAKLEELTKQIEELKAAPAKASAALSQEQLKAGTRAFLKQQLDKAKPEIASRPENVEDAIDKTLTHAAAVVQELKYDPANLTPAQAEEVAAKAIAKTEAEFDQLGKRFGKVTAPVRPSVYDKPITRAAPRVEVSKEGAKAGPSGKAWNDYVEKVRNAWETRSS